MERDQLPQPAGGESGPLGIAIEPASTPMMSPGGNRRLVGGPDPADGTPPAIDPVRIDTAKAMIEPVLAERVPLAVVARLPRREAARRVSDVVVDVITRKRLRLNLLEQRDVVTRLLNELLQRAQEQPHASLASAPPAPGAAPDLLAMPGFGSSLDAPPAFNSAPGPRPDTVQGPTGVAASRDSVAEAKALIQPLLLERIDASKAALLEREDLRAQIDDIVHEILAEQRLQLNQVEQENLVRDLVDDMLGLGPLEPLLKDEAITDIMVNGPFQVYIERKGKLTVSDTRFRDNAHVLNVCTRIVSRIGRRIDESSPLCDARLPDGSRVNIIIPPLAIDGPSISIRKFSKKSITLDIMGRQGNISPAMATVLKVASRARLNILISGGTGSGKTTLLNAMSQMIDHGERIVTIEDAAELQLQQPHVVRLETRPANLEGQGEITMRDLVKNSLRMRPDRIILGEVRGSEAVDMLQAMNTGHEGSMCTIHSNRPREALTRLENMVGMAGINLPSRAVRMQIAAAVDIILQVSRMRDGMRRVTYVTEVVGMEGDVLTTQDLFLYQFEGENPDGTLRGEFKSTGLRPHFAPKAAYFGLERALMEAL